MALTKNDAGKWAGTLSATTQNTSTIELDTAGKYVDANIVVTANVSSGELQSVAGNAPVVTAGLADTTYLTTTNTGYAITATADAAATSKSGVDAVKTAGWIPADGSVTVTTPAATQASTTKYVKAGALSNANGGAVTATSGLTSADNILQTTNNGNDYAIVATADASAANSTTGVKTAGWIPTTATATVTGQTATQAKTTKYIRKGSFDTSTLNVKTASNALKDYTENTDVAIPSEGSLLIKEGYYPNTFISLDQLLNGRDEDKEIAATGTLASLRKGSVAWTEDGQKVSGAMENATVSGSVTAVSPTYNSTSSKFDVGVTGTAKAASTGYVEKDTTTSVITSSATLDKVTVGASKGTDGAVTPVISNTTAAVTGKTQVATTPTKATTDIDTYYMAVNTAAISASTTVTPKVTAAGYGDTTNYTSAGNVTVTRGAAASGTYYIPIKSGGHELSGGADAKVTPVISQSSSTVSGKTKVSVTPTTATTDIDTYYIAINTAAKTTTSTVTCKTSEGWVPTDTTGISKTITGGANGSGNYYIPLATSTHSVAGNGDATFSGSTNATLTNTQAATGTIGSTAITPVTYTTQAAAGANYIKVTSTAKQSTAGSKTISIPIKCTSTKGYTEGDTVTFSASGSVSVGVTQKTGDIYFKVYNGEIVTA